MSEHEKAQGLCGYLQEVQAAEDGAWRRGDYYRMRVGGQHDADEEGNVGTIIFRQATFAFFPFISVPGTPNLVFTIYNLYIYI